MRFLVDNALSPVLATLLEQAGHDAVHVRLIDLHRSDDNVANQPAAVAISGETAPLVVWQSLTSRTR